MLTVLEESGLDILGEQVNINVPTSSGVRRRIVDFLAQDSDGTIFAVEVKTGDAGLSPRQTVLDEIMATQGGTIRSNNVPVPFDNLRLGKIETIYISLP